jgi:hypothetical protein
MDNIANHHQGRFGEKTARSTSKNIASSWKQAGFITGKVKNIRSQPSISYKIVAFAMLLSYLKGDKGDFLIKSSTVQALCLNEDKLRDLTFEASKRDYLQYQYAGNVTSISFDLFLNKLGINAI